KTTAAKTHTSRRLAMPDLQSLLDKIDRLDQQATKGPWIIDSIESGEHALFVDEDNPEYGHLGAASSTVASFLLAKNADFIAHARESLPQLAKALQAVMELHKTRVHDEDPTSPFCNFCGPVTPCETTQAITDALEATGVV